MQEFLNSILPTFSHLGLWGYWIILLVAFAESLTVVGSFVPGTTIAIFFGFLSSRNIFDIGDLFWFAAAGAVLGDILSFYLGGKGTHLFKDENKILKLVHLEAGERFFKKHGGKSLLLGRFLSPLRAIIPFVAGLFKMQKRVFYFWAVVSGIFWAAAYLLLGYFFGSALGVIDAWSARIGFFLLGIAAVFAIIWLGLRHGKPLFVFLKSILISIKNAIASNPEIKKLVARYPEFFAFLGRRLNRKKFSGLTLTLLALSFIYLFSLFIGIAEDVIKSDLIVNIDLRVENLLVAFRNAGLVKMFYWITVLGNVEFVGVLAVIFTVLFFVWRKRQYIVPLWVAIIGSEAFAYIGKVLISRPRPGGMIPVYAETSFSFPSGHATIAAVFYGFLAYFFWKEWPHWKNRVNIVAAWIVLALSIGLSRLYLGVHFLSDVLGGYLVGLLWLIIAISVSERHAFKMKELGERQEPGRAAKALAAMLFSFQIILFASLAINAPQFGAIAPPPPGIISSDPVSEFEKNNLPKYSEDLSATPQEPLSFIIVAKNEADLAAVFAKAGWFAADKVNVNTLIRALTDNLFNRPYNAEPVTPDFWAGRVNDFAFEKPTEADTARTRHHSRFWLSNIETPAHALVFVGTASLDEGVKWWGLTHRIAPDIDSEREFLFADLKKTGMVSKWKKVDFVSPELGKNLAGDQFFTDGRAYVIYLK